MSDNEPMETPVVEVEELTDLALVERAILGGEITVEVDPEAIAREIVRQIIAAPTADDAMAEVPIFHAKDCVGQQYELRGVRWWPSKKAQGPKVFASAPVVNLRTGEVGVLTTSAYKHLAKLVVLAREGAFPRKVEITTTSDPTGAGFWPLDFRDIAEQPEA